MNIKKLEITLSLRRSGVLAAGTSPTEAGDQRLFQSLNTIRDVLQTDG